MRLSWFISISYSKSEMARRPLTIARAPTWWANSTMSTSKESERTFGRCAVASFDQQRARRAPRQRLDAQRAGARVEVEDARAVQRPERREQRLAHAIR